MDQLEAEIAQSPELQQHRRNIEASVAEIEKELDQSLAEFHSEADRDRVLRESQGSIMRMLKNKEEDRQQAREMQQSIRQLLENAAMDRQKADERNHTLEVKLGDMTETMMLALQAEMDVKIDQTLDNLRTKVAQAQENFKSDVKTEMQNEAKAAMAKIQKGLAESYQRCLAMQEDAKQRKKETEAAAKAAWIEKRDKGIVPGQIGFSGCSYQKGRCTRYTSYTNAQPAWHPPIIAVHDRS